MGVVWAEFGPHQRFDSPHQRNSNTYEIESHYCMLKGRTLLCVNKNMYTMAKKFVILNFSRSQNVGGYDETDSITLTTEQVKDYSKSAKLLLGLISVCVCISYIFSCSRSLVPRPLFL